MSATRAATAAKTSDPESHPVSAAPDSAARMPERAANRPVNAAKASGASDSVNVASEGSTPVAAR